MMKFLRNIMLWFKTKKDYQELIIKLDKQIEFMQKMAIPEKKYVLVMPPGESDETEYNRTIASLLINPFFVFFFNDLQSRITDELTFGKSDNFDYYRGQLALISKVKESAELAFMGKLLKIVTEKEENAKVQLF